MKISLTEWQARITLLALDGYAQAFEGGSMTKDDLPPLRAEDYGAIATHNLASCRIFGSKVLKCETDKRCAYYGECPSSKQQSRAA